MATTGLNPMFQSMRGRMGELIHYNRMGKQCVRTRVIPRNPRSEIQQSNRRKFADAVSSWKRLTAEERYTWSRKARIKGKTGYNLFMSESMNKSAGIKTADTGISRVHVHQELISTLQGLPGGVLSYSVPLHLRYRSDLPHVYPPDNVIHVELRQ